MKLIYHPNNWLEKKVKPFDFDTNDAHEVSKEMISIMEKSNGVGLAANQVELDAQIFIIKPTGLKDHEDEKPIVLVLGRSKSKYSARKGDITRLWPMDFYEQLLQNITK